MAPPPPKRRRRADVQMCTCGCNQMITRETMLLHLRQLRTGKFSAGHLMSLRAAQDNPRTLQELHVFSDGSRSSSVPPEETDSLFDDSGGAAMPELDAFDQSVADEFSDHHTAESSENPVGSLDDTSSATVGEELSGSVEVADVVDANTQLDPPTPTSNSFLNDSSPLDLAHYLAPHPTIPPTPTNDAPLVASLQTVFQDDCQYAVAQTWGDEPNPKRVAGDEAGEAGDEGDEDERDDGVLDEDDDGERQEASGAFDVDPQCTSSFRVSQHFTDKPHLVNAATAPSTTQPQPLHKSSLTTLDAYDTLNTQFMINVSELGKLASSSYISGETYILIYFLSFRT